MPGVGPQGHLSLRPPQWSGALPPGEDQPRAAATFPEAALAHFALGGRAQFGRNEIIRDLRVWSVCSAMGSRVIEGRPKLDYLD